MSWKAEVRTSSCAPDSWSGNALRFATKLEANNYGLELAQRWTAVVDFHTVESTSPVNYVFEPGKRAFKVEAGGS